MIVGGIGDSPLYTKTSTGAAQVSSPTFVTPGTIVEVNLSSTNLKIGSKNGTYWFIVRAVDESGNYSSTQLIYSTASVLISTSIPAPSTTSTTTAVVTTTDIIDPNGMTTLTSLDLGGGIVLGGTIPPGSLSGSDTLQRTADPSPPSATAGIILVGNAVDITLGSGKTEFLKPITLTFSLSGAALSSIQGKKEAVIKLAFYNGTRWVVIGDSVLSGGVVSARVTHLTKFGVVIVSPVTNLERAMVYPNPYRPNVSQHGLQQITFDLLPANSVVKIYTLGGDLVKDLMDESGAGVIRWDGRNNKGEEVASGVYFGLVKGGGETRTLKIAIQR
jgi:hypothetical protein